MTWVAPTAQGPICAEVRVPGSKSATARALVLSAMADAPSSLSGALQARDTTLMVAGLRALGAAIDDHDPRHWLIEPMDAMPSEADIDCGLAGTVMRFLPPVASLGSGRIAFDGDDQARARPVWPLLSALEQVGVTVTGQGLPFCVSGPALGGHSVIDSSGSSQFVSGLLLSGARFPSGLTLRHEGPAIPSLPHIGMTIAALAARGVEVDVGDNQWLVHPGIIKGIDETIEPDLTTAAVFLASALVTGGTVGIPGWPMASTQPGSATPEILSSFGGTYTVDERGLKMSGPADGATALQGVDIDLHETSELTPVVAALAALAQSPSRIRGVGHIRHHETDRLAALAEGINGLGGDVSITEDGLIIRPCVLTSGTLKTHADHRMAHAGALLGLVIPNVGVDDIGCTAKTMPQFADVWTQVVTGGGM